MGTGLSKHPEEDTDIIWHGRPEVRLRWPDVKAGLFAFLTTSVVLSTGFAAQSGWQWSAPLRLGVSYGLVVGLVTAFGRAAGGGLFLTVTAAFWATVTAAAFNTTQQGTALVCPIVLTAVVGTFLILRYRQRRATRYQLTHEQVRVGELGRYVISFPLEDDPAVRRDWFGKSLGEVIFKAGDATLTTQDGKVFRVPPQKRVFKRILNPERVLEALQGRAEQA